MDPNANINEQREIARTIIERGSIQRDDFGANDQLADGERLAELVLALDEWRQAGGFYPSSNVYVVLAGSTTPVIFTDEAQANEYADLSGNPITVAGLTGKEAAEDLLSDWRGAEGNDEEEE